MGSVFHVYIFEKISNDQLNDLKSYGFEILCADIEGENVFTYRSDKKKILILSSESHGPSNEIEKVSDEKICIPSIGNAESLNVAATLGGLAGSLFDSWLGATHQAIYRCPSCQHETERHPRHTCGTPTEHLRGWRWLNNDLVNLACSLGGAGVAILVWILFL